MVTRSFRNSHAPTPRATAFPTANENQVVFRTRLIISDADEILAGTSP